MWRSIIQTDTEEPKKRCSFCIRKTKINWNVMRNLFQELEISIQEKNLVLTRFHQIYNHIERQFTHVQCSYSYSRIVVITGSVINPALLSIMSSTKGGMYVSLFWLVWTLQIIVSLITAYVTFFKWDKKYFMYMVYKQRVEQEIWMYLELTGQYSIVQPLNEVEVSLMHTTHQSKIKYFLTQLEKLYRKLQESDFNIESTENDNDNEHYIKATKDNKSLLRQKLMTHKIDKVLIAIDHASNEEHRSELQRTLQRLQKLQEQNYMIDSQLGRNKITEDVFEETTHYPRYPRYPR